MLWCECQSRSSGLSRFRRLLQQTLARTPGKRSRTDCASKCAAQWEKPGLEPGFFVGKARDSAVFPSSDDVFVLVAIALLPKVRFLPDESSFPVFSWKGNIDEQERTGTRCRRRGPALQG